ncbi:MAG: hypothetical protein M3Y25_10075, partial [Thermoproteota archaeon]|nr:hypothetical protein [Thermoproteota archaeon]
VSVQFPSTYKTARTFLELNPNDNDCTTLLLCTNNCSVIDNEDGNNKCTICRTSAYHQPKPNTSDSKKPIPRSVFYRFPIRARVKWLWSVPEIAKNLHLSYEMTLENIRSENKQSIYLEDIYTGQMWIDFALPKLAENKHSLFISLTNDPAGLSKDKTVNFTPWLVKFMNLSTISRRKLMIMIGLSFRTKETKVEQEQRKKVKKSHSGKYMQADLKVIVDELIDLYNNPEPIEDFSVNPPVRSTCPVYLLFTSSDLRAISKINQQKSTPAYKGACTLCNIEGCGLGGHTVEKEDDEKSSSRKKDNTYYFGSAYWLDKNDEARKHFENFRSKSKEFLKNVIKKKPTIKTHDNVVSEKKI